MKECESGRECRGRTKELEDLRTLAASAKDLVNKGGFETQRTISDWAEQTFGGSKNPIVYIERMLKECAELKRKLEQPAVISYEELADEIADVMICAYRAMDALGFQAHACIDHKMHINRNRKWTLHGDGTGQHVEGT